MKKEHFISTMIAFFAMVLFFACSKSDDPVQPPEDQLIYQVQPQFTDGRAPVVTWDDGRNGTYYGLFYKESLSIDSITVDHINRSQIAFNKHYVDSVFMDQVPNTGSITINGKKYLVYNVVLKLTNGQFKNLGPFWSLRETPSIKYKPFGDHILPEVNKNYFVRVFKTTTLISYFDWLFGKPKEKFQYHISGPVGSPAGTDNLNSNYIDGTVFVFPHK